MLKKIVRTIQSRVFFIALSVFLQLLILFTLMYFVQFSYPVFSIVMMVISWIVAFVVLNRDQNPQFKLAWTIFILALPLLGVGMYFLFGTRRLTKNARQRFDKVRHEGKGVLMQDGDVLDEIKKQNPQVHGQINYVLKNAEYPVYKEEESRYFPSGEDVFPHIKEDLQKAKDFIFIEFFIIGMGHMWEDILLILIQKKKEGVDVRVMYDDFGSTRAIPYRYHKKLEKLGISAVPFHPIRPVFSIIMNNRDHRKLVVIDGKIGYTGGINIADEYINEKERFGYWKDNAVRITGKPVMNMTTMFLEMWDYAKGITEDYSVFFPKYDMEKPSGDKEAQHSMGYVLPYADMPLDMERLGKIIYLDIINQATDYVYITTPYMIMDDEMGTALINASKRGVDVRIVLPGIPDKKIIYMMGQSNYERLINVGVKIYHYTPGFMHSKSFVSDDIIGVIGSINLDYRSLYLHFENGVYFYHADVVNDLKNDIVYAISQSEKIDLEFCRKRPKGIRVMMGILGIFSPLL